MKNDINLEDITISLSDYYDDSSANVTIGGGISSIFPGTSAASPVAWQDWNNHASGQIALDGPDADIKVNGQSLMTMLDQIQQRLNILRPNPELEAEWDQLRELGEQYRKLEAELTEKQAVWNTLKK